MKRTIRLLALFLCLLLALPLASCGAKNKKVVGSCAGREILYEELRLETLRYRETHPNATEEEIRLAVEKALVGRYAVLLLAQEYLPGTSIDGEEYQGRIDDEESRAIEQLGGKSQYKRAIKEQYANPHLMRHLLALTQLEMDVKSAMFKGTELESAASLLLWLEDGNFVRARRIRFVFTDENKSAMKAEAQAFLNRLTAGESMNDLLSSFENATALQPSYYFRGLDEGNLQDALLALTSIEVGRGRLIENGNAWEVLIHMDTEKESFVTYQLTAVLDRYRDIRFDKALTAAIAQTTVVWNEYGLSIDLGKIK
jgi:hypothetical protein